MTLSSNPQNSPEVLEQATFSELYQNSDAATYANEVDEATYLSDIDAAALAYANNEEYAGECAHAIRAFFMKVLQNDPKIKAALSRYKKVASEHTKSSEKFSAIYDFREQIKHVCGSKNK